MSGCVSCGASVDHGRRICNDCLSAEATSAQTETMAGARGSFASGTPPARFVPGARFADRYRIVGPLGQGGMGEVYRADDLRLGQPVALKLLPPDLGDDAGRRERLLNEVRLARQVAHPNVCRVYDVGEAGGQYFLSMEYVDGEDLASLLRRIGRLPEDKAVELARQLCAGLAAAHAQGILHRDLKPANVMLDGRGRVRITDFGLAAAGPVDAHDIRVGTPAYMAPEQLEGREVTVRSDLYSLGLVLYEIFTGRKAHEGASREEIVRKRMDSRSTPTSPSDHLRGLEPTIESAILRCLEHDPEKRPASALAVAAALPGGDPLAEALAAGETPSPQMVAAAGSEGSLSPAIAWSLLFLAIAGLFLQVPLLSKTKLVNMLPLDRHPEVLADIARDFIREMGYEDPPVDHAQGFLVDSASLDWIRDNDPSPARWERLTTGWPAALHFWYRESREPMRPWLGGWGTVDPEDPPPLSPGMKIIELSPRGHLLRFQAVPDTWIEQAGSPAAPDWSRVLEMAGIDGSALEEVEPIVIPPAHSDLHVAWTGSHPDAEGTTFRVEAASLRGRLVFFRIIEPWNTEPDSEMQPNPAAVRYSQVIASWFSIALLAAGALLAWRNVRLGREDRSAATKMAAAVMLVHLLVWLVQAHHAGLATQLFSALESMIADTLYMAMIVWISYVALEPFVRRRWPRMLVSWNRLLGGGLRDPLVGRDLLIGSASAVSLAIIYSVQWTAVRFQALPPDPERTRLMFLAGPLSSLAEVLDLPLHVLFDTMQMFFFFVLMRVILRRTWLAAFVFLVLAAILTIQFSRQGFSAPFIPVMLSLFLFVMIRYGFLATAITSMLFALAVNAPMSTSFDAWYAIPGLAVVLVTAAAATFGFMTTRAGRPLFEGLLKDQAQ